MTAERADLRIPAEPETKGRRLKIQPVDVTDIIRAVRVGIPYTALAAAYNVTPPTIRAAVVSNLVPEVPGMSPVAPAARTVLGEAALTWATANPDAVSDVKDRCDAADWTTEAGTVVLLALAEGVHAELTEQTDGEAPTLRTALYRLMEVYGLSKAAYESLVYQTTKARKSGVLPRDFWADAEPSTVHAPRWWTAEAAIAWRFRIIRPSDPLAATGHVFGVVTETRGAAPAINGAIRKRLGFTVPVWHLGGTGSIPRRLHIEQEMLAWAERTGCEPHLLVVTDYDPSGLIIADSVASEVRDVDVQRIGMWPRQAPGRALTAEGIKEPDKEDTSHRKSEAWQDAIAEHGSVEYQAEACDYATWAEHVADAIERHVDLEDAEDEYDDSWDEADALMERLAGIFAGSDGPQAMLDALTELSS